VSNPSQSFNLTKQNDVWVETTNTHNQVAPAMYEIKKITRQKEVN
jgi:hypothetical protein